MSRRMESATPDSRQLGLVGIGLLGSALAERLVRGGFRVAGYDLVPERRAAFLQLGGEGLDGAAAVFAGAPRVLLSLPSHREVEQVLGEAAGVLRPGQILVDTSTGDPAAAERAAGELAARGVVYLDATLSGSSAQVRAGSAVVMVGGDRAAYDACADVLGCLGSQRFHTGGPGSGAKMKLATNIVLGLNRAALAEGLAFARGIGLDPAQALAIMRAGPAYSRIMDGKGEKMLKGDFSPEARLSQHLKDVRLMLEHGAAAGLPMTLSAAHREILEAAEAAGLGALDNSALIKVLSAPLLTPAP